MLLKPGCVVIATAGRDEGKRLVVLAADGRFVTLADGKRRTLEQPKRKSVRHVRRTEAAVDLTTATNKSLRGVLRALCATEKGGTELV